ncbi:uncharacterized protein LOC123535137 isoform X2 [Mercenaria mercenaria]|nr:uncharacterized protein LOC123535137 isoform X2 [Mercenaria mercenaria]
MNYRERTDEHLNSVPNGNANLQQGDRESIQNYTKRSPYADSEKELLTSQTEITCAKGEENDTTKNYPLTVHTVVENSNSPDQNRQFKDEDFPNDDLYTSQQVALLTRANLKQHTRILKEHSSKYKRTHEEYESKENANDSVEDVTEERIHIASESSASENRSNGQKAKEDPIKTVSERLKHDIEYTGNSESKSTNGSITQFSEKVIQSSSKASLKDKVDTPQLDKPDSLDIAPSLQSGRHQNHSSVKKSPQSNVKREVKKIQKINIDDIETLVSREKYSKAENRKRTQRKERT